MQDRTPGYSGVEITSNDCEGPDRPGPAESCAKLTTIDDTDTSLAPEMSYATKDRNLNAPMREFTLVVVVAIDMAPRISST
jgi:hypothetical protein